MKRKRLGDAAKPGNYAVNAAFCDTASHAKAEERRLERQRQREDAAGLARKALRVGGMATARKANDAAAEKAAAHNKGVPVTVGKDGKTYMSRAARRKLKKLRKASEGG